jgi:SAM-dependent methyltransferase
LSTTPISLVPCPLCGERERFIDVRVPYEDEHIASYGGLYAGRSASEWKICGRCGFLHQNPRPSAMALDAFYAAAKYRQKHDDPDAGDYGRFAEWYFGPKVDYVSRVCGLATGSVFEVGCGFGAALLTFRSRGWSGQGIEPDAHCAAYARDQLKLPGVRTGLLGPDFSPDHKVDVVFSNHAFEHFADLDAVMQGVRAVLNPGGFIVTVVPTFRENRSSMSKRWMNSGHYSLFSHASLSHLMSKHGFEPTAHTYRGWLTEIDELWHCARFTGAVPDPARFFEDPRAVEWYLSVTNPVRTVLYYPVFDRWNKKRDLFHLLRAGVHSFLRSPRDFHRRAYARWQATRHNSSR